MNETLVYLPFSKRVVVQAFCDSSAPQWAVFTPKVGAPFELTATGVDNTPMGRKVIETPAPEPGQQGFLVKVLIQAGKARVNSAMVQGRQYSVAAYNMICIASEDGGDSDWNDCTVLFTWSTPIG